MRYNDSMDNRNAPLNAAMALQAQSHPVEEPITQVIRNRLLVLLKEASSQGSRARSLADRLVGSVPEKVGEGKNESTSRSAVDEIFDLITDIQANLDHNSNQLYRLEKL